MFSPVSSCRRSTARSTGVQAATLGSRRIPVEAGRVEVRQRHPARVADAGVSAGQRDVAQVADPPVVGVGRDHELTAPDRAVVAVAGAVEGEADHRLVVRVIVLGHRRRQVGVVVLDPDELSTLLVLGGPGTAAIARMAVGHEQLGLHSRSRSPDDQRRCRTRAAWPGRPCRRRARSARRTGRRRPRTCSSGRPRRRASAGPAAAGRSAAARTRGTGAPAAAGHSDHERRCGARSRRRARGSAGRGSARRRRAPRAGPGRPWSSVTIGSPARLPLVMHQGRRAGRIAGQPEQQPVHRACRAASPRGPASPGRHRRPVRALSLVEGRLASSTTGRRGR